MIRIALRVLLLLAVLQLGAAVASAHDCAVQEDCEETAGYISAVAVAGGIVAILTGLLGSELGGAVGEAAARPPVGETAEPAPVRDGEAGAAEVPVAPAHDIGIEIPWDELIAATSPPETGIDDLLGEPGLEPEETGLAEEVVPSGEAPTEPLDDPSEGEPAIDELVPEEVEEEAEGAPEEEPEEEPEEAAEEPEEEEAAEGPKPPGLETVEGIGDIAGQVKDGVDWVKEQLDDLPIDDDTKEELGEQLDEVGGHAETVKGVADKAKEYIEVLDENLQRTERMGISDQSRDFLAWFRVTIKAAGELGEKFVDGLTAPVRALLPDKVADKAEELLHDAVPIKEFGEELSKLPTSAAQNVTNAQRRDQLDAVTGDAPTGDPFDGMEDVYRWP